MGGIRAIDGRPVFDLAQPGEDGRDFALLPESDAARRVEALRRALREADERSDDGLIVVHIPQAVDTSGSM